MNNLESNNMMMLMNNNNNMMQMNNMNNNMPNYNMMQMNNMNNNNNMMGINSNKRFEVCFVTPIGKRIILFFNYGTTIKQILLKYVKIIGLNVNVIGNSVYFIYNGQKIRTNDTDKIKIEDYFENYRATIIVLDREKLIGG